MKGAGFPAALVLALLLGGCGGEGEGPPERVHVPQGASFSQVVDSLAAHEMVRAPWAFRLYGRLSGSAGSIKPGTYEFRRHAGWEKVMDDLVAGRVITTRVVIPEGWDLRKIAPRIAAETESDPDTIHALLLDSATVERHGVPGPSMEGYLYPATYIFPARVSADSVIATMVRRYARAWTPERRAAADSLGMSEQEVVTLASIVEREAKIRTEMPLIASVYHNRLRIGMPLQADPTVQYALGDHQTRLLYAHIDSVADHPYNTYTHRGLPPGPIGSPSEAALDAVLEAMESHYLYFVAEPDGSHIFSRSLEEHNRVRARQRRERREAEGAPPRPEAPADSVVVDSAAADAAAPPRG